MAQKVLYVAVQNRSNSAATASLVFGVMALLLCWIPIINVIAAILAVCGIFLAFVGFLIALGRDGSGLGFVFGGAILNGIALVPTALVLLAIIGLASAPRSTKTPGVGAGSPSSAMSSSLPSNDAQAALARYGEACRSAINEEIDLRRRIRIANRERRISETVKRLEWKESKSKDGSPIVLFGSDEGRAKLLKDWASSLQSASSKSDALERGNFAPFSDIAQDAAFIDARDKACASFRDARSQAIEALGRPDSNVNGPN